MPAKDKKAAPAKAPKASAASGGKSAKKKKWSKGKSKEKLNNLVLFDKTTYEKLYKEVPTYKLITPSIVSDRLRINGGLAIRGIRELAQKKLIKKVVVSGKQIIYTRAAAEPEKPKKEDAKPKEEKAAAPKEEKTEEKQ